MCILPPRHAMERSVLVHSLVCQRSWSRGAYTTTPAPSSPMAWWRLQGFPAVALTVGLVLAYFVPDDAIGTFACRGIVEHAFGLVLRPCCCWGYLVFFDSDSIFTNFSRGLVEDCLLVLYLFLRRGGGSHHLPLIIGDMVIVMMGICRGTDMVFLILFLLQWRKSGDIVDVYFRDVLLGDLVFCL